MWSMFSLTDIIHRHGGVDVERIKVSFQRTDDRGARSMVQIEASDC